MVVPARLETRLKIGGMDNMASFSAAAGGTSAYTKGQMLVAMYMAMTDL
jgi:hypothetical protein